MEILKINTDRRRLGDLGEREAAKLLKKKGYRILEKNYVMLDHEIDIIAECESAVVFVEVKTRSCLYPESGAFGIPANAVDISKRKNTVKAARDYLASYYGGKQPRLDVIEVYIHKGKSEFHTPTVLKVNHIRNAFDARGRKLH